MRTIPGKEDQELPMLQRISLLELPDLENTNLQHPRLQPIEMLLRVQVADISMLTVQRRLAKKPLLWKN